MNKEKIYELMPLLFELFFPGKTYMVKTTSSNVEDETEWYCIENGFKHCVMYDFIENHIEVFKVSEYDFNLVVYLEGSPEDIIKVAKILEK